MPTFWGLLKVIPALASYIAFDRVEIAFVMITATEQVES